MVSNSIVDPSLESSSIFLQTLLPEDMATLVQLARIGKYNIISLTTLVTTLSYRIMTRSACYSHTIILYITSLSVL